MVSKVHNLKTWIFSVMALRKIFDSLLSFEFKYFLLLLYLEYNIKMTQHILKYCPSHERDTYNFVA